MARVVCLEDKGGCGISVPLSQIYTVNHEGKEAIECGNCLAKNCIEQVYTGQEIEDALTAFFDEVKEESVHRVLEFVAVNEQSRIDPAAPGG